MILDERWILRVEEIKVDFIIINYFNNLMGRVLFGKEIRGLFDVVEENGVKVFLDEVYVEFSFICFMLVREFYENVVIVKGFLKFYFMIGFRFGYVIGEWNEIRRI